MKRLIAVGLMALITTHANAGFITGFVVGSMTAPKDTQRGNPLVVSSDVKGHDVITCERSNDTNEASPFAPRCTNYIHVSKNGYGTMRQQTVYEYAASLGYSKVYALSIMAFPGGTVAYVMEVGK